MLTARVRQPAHDLKQRQFPDILPFIVHSTHPLSSLSLPYPLTSVIPKTSQYLFSSIIERPWGIEVIDLDLDEAKELLAEFIERNPSEWYGGHRQNRVATNRYGAAAMTGRQTGTPGTTARGPGRFPSARRLLLQVPDTLALRRPDPAGRLPVPVEVVLSPVQHEISVILHPSERGSGASPHPVVHRSWIP